MRNTILYILALFLVTGCTEKNPAMLMAKHKEIYVPINASSVALLGGPVWKTEPGLSKIERDNLAYIYGDVVVDRKKLPALIVYTSRANIPSGTFYTPMKASQLYEEFLRVSYPLALSIDPVEGVPNRHVLTKSAIRAADRRMKKGERLPLQISRAD